MKKVGIIGSGNVGQALAKGFVENGYQTTIASRSEEKRKELEQAFEGKIKTDSLENTARNNEIIVFAVKGGKAKEALAVLKVDNLKGKTVIDATNPIEDAAPVKGVLVYSTSINKSLMEELQEMATEAKFVKAFNSVGAGHMVNPLFESKPTMFICGNDAEAKKEVSEILDKFGWETADMGFAEAARAIEPLAMLWCIPGFSNNSWNHAFKLLKK
ncbi:NADPH-dependent F420 reductase [Maribellus maritimus]|uniref:NADPH-dependent F420 reductase n=1 Tax=Maribellus maritimus TaxID=2870838 RepID=UPI001EEADF22|nr:NAD(P)-binding domain-containing protein [Maribellus maritimus]MCG6186661.1 NAD(P)-binding domain-containing protein [Maribellus maritimus]